MNLYICQLELVPYEYQANFDEHHLIIAKSHEEAKAHFMGQYHYLYADEVASMKTTPEKWFNKRTILHEIPLADIPRL